MAAVSAKTGDGLDEVVRLMMEAVGQMREHQPVLLPSVETQKRYTYRPEFDVRRRGKVFEVSGEKPEKWASMTNFENEEAVNYLCRKLSHLNLDPVLRREGAEGAVVLRIKEYEFEYQLR